MFVRDEVRLPVSFRAAQARLASLARGGVLLSAAQDAADDVTAGRARVGPVGPVPGLSRVVEVQFRELIARGDSAQLALRWEAAGQGGALFPALDADITLTRADDSATTMTIAGVYRPPLAGLGASLDQLILHRVAAATIRDFLSRVADAIAFPQATAEQRRAGWYQPLPEPGPVAEPGGAS